MMRKDEFTKSLDSILGKYGASYQEVAKKLAKKIFEYMEAGDTVAQAYRKAIKDVSFAAVNKAAVEDAVYESALKGYGITAPPVLATVEGEAVLRHKLMDVSWNADKLNLSTRLHGVEKALHNNVRNTVGVALRQYKTIRETAMLLYDGYNNPEKVLNEAELPQYLEKIKELTTKMYSGDRRAARESEIYRRAERDIKKLKTPGLRAAYNEAAEAATEDKPSALKKARKMLETGSSQEEINQMLLAEREKALDKALYVATQEKTRYYAERIARTESARAYYEGQMAQAENNPDIFGFKWAMSSAHVHKNSDCECYEYSKLDVGYGPGVYPKDDVPELPAHPNCMCHLRKVYTWEVQHTNGKDKLPEKKRGKNRVKEAEKEANKLYGSSYGSVELGNNKEAIYKQDNELYLQLQESLPKTYKEWPDLPEGPRSIEESARYANIKYKDTNEASNNCQRSVIAYDMQRKGKNAIAQRIYGDWNKDRLSQRIDIAYKGGKTIDRLPDNGRSSIESLVKGWGDGSRGVINISWKKNNVGHNFVVENVRGKLVYIDPQTGVIGARVEKFFDNAIIGQTSIMRIDNLMFNDEYLRKACEIG